MKRYILLIIVAIATVFIYQIFSNDNKEIPEFIQTATEVQMTDTLNLGILSFDTMNPIESKNEHIQYISKLIYEPLFDISYQFEIQPKLATEYSQLDDTTYIIKLRENVFWHDNTIFNSTNVEQVIFKIKSNTNSIFYNNVKNIKNAKIIDENTLRLELYEKEPFFEYNLIFPIIKDETIGTGKYFLENDTLKYYNEYWQKLNPSITTINIKKYNEMGEMYNAFKSGELDVISTKEIEYKTILGEIGFNKKEYAGREYTSIELNNIDKDVRQAIYYAVNKNEIISKVYSNNYYDSEFPLDTANWLYKDIIKHKYDIEKSIQILENSGWQYQDNYWQKDGQKLILTILLESENQEKNNIAYILKNQLDKIGVRVNLEKVSKNLYNYYLKNKKYDIIINTKYIGISPRLDTYFHENLIIDQIQKQTNDERKMIELYQKLEENYIEELPFIVLCCSKQTLIYSEKIHGSIMPNWYSIFYDIENWKKNK